MPEAPLLTYVKQTGAIYDDLTAQDITLLTYNKASDDFVNYLLKTSRLKRQQPNLQGPLGPQTTVNPALIPYIDRENILAVRPSERKTAVMLFTFFCILGLIVTFVGIFFRGPGYTFVIPYVTSPGLHFAL